MRYVAGFIGGFIVAVLLLVFQQHLIGSDHEHLPPSPVIKLDSVFRSPPAEEKPYERRKLPPKPETIDPVTTVISPVATGTVRPVPVELPAMGIERGDGQVVRIDIGSGVMDGGAMVKVPVQPDYPVSALRNRIEGEVEVEFTVRADGSVADVDVIRANPRGVFEQSAVRAVLRWQFAPKRRNGVAMPARVRQVIAFELPEE